MGSRESIEPDDLHVRFEGSEYCSPVLSIRQLQASALAVVQGWLVLLILITVLFTNLLFILLVKVIFLFLLMFPQYCLDHQLRQSLKKHHGAIL